MIDPIYFYTQTSFVVISIIIILVYIFLSLYMKQIYRNLNRHIEKTNRNIENVEKHIEATQRHISHVEKVLDGLVKRKK